LARTLSLASTISRARRSTSPTTCIDAEPIDQVQDLDLLSDGRRPHRRRLQAVAQRLVIEHHARRLGRRADLVPVVYQRFKH
jgi:hypothetical protein